MSSSRSISAARQRRAGDPAPVSQRPPVTSINSQKAFSQQQQQQQQQANKNQVPSQAPQVPVGKLSVGDAFALVTIRLGRIETIIQKLEAEGVIGPNANHGGDFEHDENMRLVDDTVIRNMIARLNDLEKGQTTISTKLETNAVASAVSNKTANSDEEISSLQKQIDQVKTELAESKVNGVDSEIEQTIYQKMTHLQNQIFHLKNDFMELKEILMKLQSFSMETNQKVVSISSAQETMAQNLLLVAKNTESVQASASVCVNDSVSISVTESAPEPEPEPQSEPEPMPEPDSAPVEDGASTEVEENANN